MFGALYFGQTYFAGMPALAAPAPVAGNAKGYLNEWLPPRLRVHHLYPEADDDEQDIMEIVTLWLGLK